MSDLGDDILYKRANEADATLGQILQQLKILTLIMRQASGVYDDDVTLLRQEPPVLQKANYPT